MRTTVTLDADVAAQLEREMRASGKGFKRALNDALRQGLAPRSRGRAIEPFVVRARELGRHPGLDYRSGGDLLELAEGPDRR
jgi:hypothetical protein